MSLDEFIKENHHQALSVVKRSKYLKMLDDDDQSEVIYSSLWVVYEKFNPDRASLFRFLNVIIHHHIFKIIKKKLRIRNFETSINDLDFGYEPTDITEMFTDKEWKIVSPLLTSTYAKSANQIGLSNRKYKILLRSITENVIKREK